MRRVPRVKSVNDLDENERSIIRQVISLMLQLPDEPHIYLRAIGQLREREFGIRGRSRGEKPKGYIRP